MKNKLLTLILSIICLATTLIAVISIKDVTNGYESVTLKPELYDKLGYVNCSVKTVRGILESSWSFEEDGTVKWSVTVPAGTTAAVYFPRECVSVNGVALTEQEGITVGNDGVSIGSGSYVFILK